MKTPGLEAIVKATWGEPSVRALMEPLLPGKILEVGFGSGYSAGRIEVIHPKQHIIIEPHPQLAANAVRWAGSNPRVGIIEDSWENALEDLGVFDVIFFNLITPDVHAARETGNLIVKQGKELIDTVNEQLPQLTKTRYSDADIDYFFAQLGQHMGKEKSKFIHDLKENGQVTDEQYEQILDRHHLKKMESSKPAVVENQKDTLLAFLEACLAKHTRRGSRIFCFISSGQSQFDNPQFFEKIITNPNVKYHEKTLVIDTPKGQPSASALLGIVERIQ